MNKLQNKLAILVLIVMSATPILWFIGKGDILITGLDTNFPLDPLIWFQRRFFVWNTILNGGVDFSSSMSGLFFHFLQVFPVLLGFGLRTAEIFSIVFWFGCIAFSSYFFATSFLNKNKLGPIIFSVIYCFNTYVFNTWENIKVSNLALLVGLPLFLGILHRYQQNKITLKGVMILSIVGAVITSGSGINPAYFITIILAIFLYTLLHIKTAAKAFLLVLAVLGLVNLYWMLPLFNFLFFSQSVGNLTDIGLTNWLDSLSENTSFLNVLRLQGAWDWYAKDAYGAPLYIPYSVKYFNHPVFIIFSFTFAFLSVLSFIFNQRNKRKLYGYFGMLLVLGVFLASGTHAPSGGLFTFLTKYMPFFSFFRSPWYIFTPLIILSFSGLIALLYAKLSEYKSYKPLVFVAGIVYLVGNLVYCYPLLTGKIFRPGRHDSFYVNFPDYVFDAKNYLSSKPEYPRILTYPDDQLENFSWGYRGTESILGIMSPQEVMTPSFNGSNEGLNLLMTSTYSNLKKHQYMAAYNQMQYLGANTIFNKKDTFSLSERIDENNDEFTSLFNKTAFGAWEFFEGKDQPVGKITAVESIYRNLNDNLANADISSYLDSSKVIVNAFDTEAEKIPNSIDTPVFVRSTNKTLESDPTSNRQTYNVTIPRQGKFTLLVEDKGVENGQVEAILDSSTTLNNITRKNGFIEFSGIDIKDGDHTIEVIYPQMGNLVETIDYSKFSQGLNLRSDELPLNPKSTLVAFSDKDIVKQIVLQIQNFNPYLRYVVDMDSKYYYGSVPIIELIQSAPSAPVKAQTHALGSSSDWETTRIFYDPIETNSKMEITIKLPPNNRSTRSKTFFENVSFKRVYDNKVYFVEEDQGLVSYSKATTTFEKINPTKYKVNVENAQNGYILLFKEAYSPHWAINASGTKGTPIHFSANGWSNAWYVPAGEGIQTVYLNYEPQGLVYKGFTITILGLGALGYFILYRNKNEKSKA